MNQRIISIACFVLAIALFTNTIVFSNSSSGSQSIPEEPAYTVRAPIRINSNPDFDAPHGVTGGSGTPGDPWIIEGWEINATDDTRIEIVNTTAYYVIKNCRIYGEDFINSGIYLINATNGELRDSKLNNSRVIVSNSDFQNVSNNTFKGNWSCLNILQSDNNVIYNNTFTGNYSYLWAQQTTALKVFNNYFNSTSYSGADFTLSPSLTLWNNTFINCGVQLTSSSTIDSVEIYTNNTVNGYPIYFYKYSDGIDIDGWDVGQIILYCCSNFTMSNLLITNTSRGLHSMASIYGSIQNFTFKGGNTGIYLDGGHNITLEGAYVDDSGVSIGYVDDSVFSNVTAQDCGFSLRNSDNNLGNNITASGMYLSGSDWNNISNVNISNSIGDGLYFVQAENNTIINASINNSGRYGIMMWLKCKYNLIKDFNIENCTDSAIYMMEHPSGSPEYNIFENGQIINNSKSGEFEESSNTQIINCTFQKNKFGLTIEDSPNFLISNSKFNQTGIITIENSNGSSIISNSIFDTGYGLVINASKNLTIKGNQIKNIRACPSNTP